MPNAYNFNSVMLQFTRSPKKKKSKTELIIYLQVIPPGMDFSNVMVNDDDIDGELIQLTGGTDGSSPKAIPPIWSEVSGWFVLCFVTN